MRRRWLRIFVAGLGLLYVTERVMVATGNVNYVPSVILLGSFLVPVTFVDYLYERFPDWEMPVGPLITCFLWGGAVGTVLAGALEYDLLRNLGVFALLGVGFIEESAKLLFPLAYFFAGRYRSEASGILFGVASAMGFAALETTGYAFVTLLQSRGSLGVLDGVLLVRGLMSPAGHASWTGLVCAVLWRERLKAGRAIVNWRVVAAFLTAVVLHALWDTFNSLQGVVALLGLGIALVSLIFLIRRIREAAQALKA